MGWIVALAVLSAIGYAARKVWQWQNTPPDGYTLEIMEQGGRFERVIVRDPNGRCVRDGNYTSVYGLGGAARSAIREARSHGRIVNRSPAQLERFRRTYKIGEEDAGD